MIRLESLLYLQEVAKTKSINKAADNLFISKSALSVAIKNLENEFEVALINRSVHGVSLTEAGENVVEKANLIFNIIHGMKNECQLYAKNGQEFHFFMENSFGNSVFPYVLGEIKKNLPNAYISIECCAFDEIFEKVRESKKNIGIFLSTVLEVNQHIDKEKYADCIFKHMASYQVFVATAKYSRHVPMNVAELSWEEIKDVPQVELKEARIRSNNAPQERIGNYVLSTDNNNVYYQAILNDYGIGQMLKIGIPFGLTDRKNLRLIPMKDQDDMDLWMIYNKSSDLDELEHLYSMIKKALEENG